jgi:hypothetical protein
MVNTSSKILEDIYVKYPTSICKSLKHKMKKTQTKTREKNEEEQV